MSQQQSFSAYGTIVEILKVDPASKQDTFNVFANLSIATGFKSDNGKSVIDYRLISVIFTNLSKSQVDMLDVSTEISIFNARILALTIKNSINQEIIEYFSNTKNISDIIQIISTKAGIPIDILEKLIPNSRKTSIIEVPNNCWQLRATSRQIKNSSKFNGVV